MNNIFEKAADRRLGGIREDKIIRILPSGTISKEKYNSIINDLGMQNGINKNTNENRSKKKKKDLRVISRGPFLAMFSYESVSFLNMLALNEKADREKKMIRTANKQSKKLQSPPHSSSQSLPQPIGSRARANTAPSSSSTGQGSSNDDTNDETVNSISDIENNISTTLANGSKQEFGKTKRRKSKSKGKSRRSQSKTKNMEEYNGRSNKKYDRRGRKKQSQGSPEKGAATSREERISPVSHNYPRSQPLSDINMNVSTQSYPETSRVSLKKDGSINPSLMNPSLESESISLHLETAESSSSLEDLNNISYSYSSTSESESEQRQLEKSKNKKKRDKRDKNYFKDELQQETDLQLFSNDIQEKHIEQQRQIYQMYLSQSQKHIKTYEKSEEKGECVIFQHVSSFFTKLFPPRGSAVVGVAPMDKKNPPESPLYHQVLQQREKVRRSKGSSKRRPRRTRSGGVMQNS